MEAEVLLPCTTCELSKTCLIPRNGADVVDYCAYRRALERASKRLREAD